MHSMIKLRKQLFLLTTLIGIYTVNLLQAQDNISPIHLISRTKYAHLVDFDSGQTLFSKNGDKKMVPSSMTKIMTAYIVFEKLQNGSLNLSDKLIVTRNAAVKGGSKMFVAADQQVSIEDLLKGVIILSGNDASIVLAEGLYGTETAFVLKMNEVANKLGMHDTNFINSTGWPDEEHFSSAKDLANLTLAMINKFPEYYYLHSLKNYRFNKIKQNNRNGLIGIDGIDGVKTGYTDAGGYGIVMSAKKGDRRLIAVVNGLKTSKERERDAGKLLDFGFVNFKNISFSKERLKRQEIIRYANVDQVSINTQGRVVVTVPSNYRESDIIVRLILNKILINPLKKGDIVGEFQFLVAENKKLIKKVNAVLEQDIIEGGLFKYAFQHIKYFFIDLW